MLGKVPPGATPIDDASGLKIKGITTLRELYEHEAKNILKAFIRYLAARPTKAMAPFDFSWMLRLHEQMFGEVWQWAGKLRTGDLNIGVSWQHVEGCVYQLAQNLHVWNESGVSLLEQATWLHHEAVRIHPFLNGNGRWSRLLANIWLKQHNHGIIKWPEEAIGTDSTIRDEYLAAIRKADEGDFDQLLELHRRHVEFGLEDEGYVHNQQMHNGFGWGPPNWRLRSAPVDGTEEYVPPPPSDE